MIEYFNPPTKVNLLYAEHPEVIGGLHAYEQPYTIPEKVGDYVIYATGSFVAHWDSEKWDRYLYGQGPLYPKKKN